MTLIEITRFKEDGIEGNPGWSDFSFWRDGLKIGRASIDHDKNYVDEVFFDTAYRGKGYGKMLYDHIEQVLGVRLVPSPRMGPGAVKFWRKRLGEPHD